MRALTIPRFESFTFDVERDKKINGDEEAFLFSVMRMLGMSDYVPEAVYQQIADVMNNPDHEWRKIGRAMNQLARTGRAPARLDDQGNNNPDFITIEQLQRSGAITEGFHSLQALRALDNYITAKNNPQQKQFSTKFTTELDAAQSGPTIQGAQIGNYKALAAGGLPLFEHYYNNRTNKKSRFTLPKLYAATAGEAQGRITKLIELNEDKNFVSFVQAIFGQPDSLNNIDLKNLWNNQVGFAKTGLVGASYGQGEDGSVLAIAEKIKKHFEEDMPIADVNNIIETVNKMFGANSMYINKRSGRIEVQGEAFKQLNALAKIYTDSMFEVDPAILEYSKSMRQVYQTLVKVAKFQEDNPGVMGDFTAPQMVYMEPSSTKNVYNSSWIKGMSTSMLRENIQGEDKKFNFLNSEITYKSGSLGVDIQKEAESLVFGNARGLQSEAITRFPVVSIHGLDDLVKSITISELKRKYPDEFKFYIDVWDAGIVMPNIAGRYAEEYNKAWTSVMLNNQFFKQIVEGLDNSLASVGTLDDKRISQDLQEVIDEIDKMRRLTNDIYRTRQATDKPDLFDKRGKKELDAYMKAFGTDQIYAQENENNIARRRALASRGNPAIATVKPKGSSAQAYLDSL